jgi:hypothetical protein
MSTRLAVWVEVPPDGSGLPRCLDQLRGLETLGARATLFSSGQVTDATRALCSQAAEQGTQGLTSAFLFHGRQISKFA